MFVVCDKGKGGHATSGRMIPMPEAPPLPSLLSLYIYMFVVCDKGKGGHATSGRMIPMLEAPPLPSLLSLSLSLSICLWFVTRGREGVWTNSRQHSLLL